MTILSDVNELDKIVRKYLISQSQLPAERVRNSLSTYGETLDKLLFKQTYDTICACDELMLFEVKARKNDADVSMTESDGTVSFFKSYEVYVIVYGNNAPNVANNAIARLRTENCRLAMLNEGVYLESVTEDDSINEFVNDVMWRRHDFSLFVSCKLQIDQTLESIEFEEIDQPKIYERREEE